MHQALGLDWGSLIGALLMVTMQHYLAGFAEWVVILQSVVFVLVVLLFQRGLVGELLHWRKRRDQACLGAPRTSSLKYTASDTWPL